MPSESQPLVTRITTADRDWVAATLVQEWTSTSVVRRGELIQAATLPGYLATLGGRRVGLVLIDVREGEFEVVAISTSQRRAGIGRALMERCFAEARTTACRRVWVVTTNNNIAAIAFYQHLGMDLRALNRNALRVSRKLKPTIPVRDATGVPIDHELEFELILQTDLRPRTCPARRGSAPCCGWLVGIVVALVVGMVIALNRRGQGDPSYQPEDPRHGEQLGGPGGQWGPGSDSGI